MIDLEQAKKGCGSDERMEAGAALLRAPLPGAMSPVGIQVIP